MVIELSGVQFWSEILLIISNRTEITRMISDQIALHSVQLPLLISDNKGSVITRCLCALSITGNSAG